MLFRSKTGALQLTIKDDGKGMDVNAVDQTNHFGLLGMRERVQGFKGSFNVDSEPNAQLVTKVSSKKAGARSAGNQTSGTQSSGTKPSGTTIYINIPQAVQ